MAVRLHNLKSLNKTSPKKRVGRGNASGKGTYASRGIKGQRARSGGQKGLKKRSLMKQLIKKTPKIGGFKSLQKKSRAITLADLEKNFQADDKINISVLRAKKAIKSSQNKAKIIARGRLTKKLTIENLSLTKQAAQQIEKTGGKIIYNNNNESIQT